jgi:hypothetical protein
LRLYKASFIMLWLMPADLFYTVPRLDSTTAPAQSFGEHLLRGAAVIEQTFGGITANLWDDPFEWTLPETLKTPELVGQYLSEVQETRRRAFDSFSSDEELSKEIMMPSGESRQLFSLLLQTLARAANHQGSAFAVYSLFVPQRPPRRV